MATHMLEEIPLGTPPSYQSPPSIQGNCRVRRFKPLMDGGWKEGLAMVTVGALFEMRINTSMSSDLGLSHHRILFAAINFLGLALLVAGTAQIILSCCCTTHAEEQGLLENQYV